MIGARSRAPFARAVLLLLLALLGASSAFALDIPPTPTQWLVDGAHILNASDAEALNQKLRDFEQTSGVQFIIYTLPSLEGEALDDFSIRAAEKWKIGNKKYDNGLILFVFPQERKMRLEVAYGLESTVTDAYSSRVIREIIAPKFAANDYAGGLNAGADALIARISGKEAPVAPVSGSGTRRGAPSGVSGIDFRFLFFLAIIFLFFILPILRRSGGRRGGCGGCGGCWPLFFFPGGGGGMTFGGGGFGGGGGWGGGGGGFSAGGGSFGGGGASGGW
jgi:uncharacterized protein